MIKALIFDFAGVIGTNGFWEWLKENVQDMASEKDYFLKISEDVDRGAMGEKEFVSLVSKRTGRIKEEIWPEVYKKIKIDDEILFLIQIFLYNYEANSRQQYKLAIEK